MLINKQNKPLHKNFKLFLYDIYTSKMKYWLIDFISTDASKWMQQIDVKNYTHYMRNERSTILGSKFSSNVDQK